MFLLGVVIHLSLPFVVAFVFALGVALTLLLLSSCPTCLLVVARVVFFVLPLVSVYLRDKHGCLRLCSPLALPFRLHFCLFINVCT